MFSTLLAKNSYAQIKTGSGGGHDREKYGSDVEVFGEKKTDAEIKIIFKRKDFGNVGLASGEYSMVLKTTIPKLIQTIIEEYNKTWGLCHNQKIMKTKDMFDVFTTSIIREQIPNIDLMNKVNNFKKECKSQERATKLVKVENKKCIYNSRLSTHIDFLLLFAQDKLIHYFSQNQTKEETLLSLQALRLLSEINMEKVNEK